MQQLYEKCFYKIFSIFKNLTIIHGLNNKNTSLNIVTGLDASVYNDKTPKTTILEPKKSKIGKKSTKIHFRANLRKP